MGVAAVVCALCLLLPAYPAGAQSPDRSSEPDQGWRVTVYPVLAWVPTSIEIDLNLPPSNGDSGVAGSIIDTRFDGAFFGGVSAARGPWRIDSTVLWAGVGGDRPERPVFRVDADLVYFYASGGRRLFGDVYATAGVRRLAMNYDIDVDGVGRFERKPGVWDPLVGLGWHPAGRWFELHATFEAGGFGAGTDLELAAAVRFDLKPFRHFGLTGGYQILYFELEDTALNREFRVEQSVHGPMVGIGFYF